MTATATATAADLRALRDEIVSAACGWSGAVRGNRLYPSKAGERIEAQQRQRLLDAVAAYLADDEAGETGS